MRLFKNLSPFIILALLILYFSYRQSKRSHKSTYTYGRIIGIKQGVRGNVNLYYSFHVDSKSYEGFVTTTFCSECNYECCNPNDTVIVRYERGNPTNNDLVHQLPRAVQSVQ